MFPSTLLLESTECNNEYPECSGTLLVHDNNGFKRSKHEKENYEVPYLNDRNGELMQRITPTKSSHNNEPVIMEVYHVKEEIDPLCQYEINHTPGDHIWLLSNANIGITSQECKPKIEPLGEDSFDEVIEIHEIILEPDMCDDIMQIKEEPDGTCCSTEYTASKFVCHHCSAEFNKKSNLRRHIITIHEETVTKFWYCTNNCGKRYKYRHGMLQHMLYVCGKAKQFVCDHCKKRFFLKNTLAIHIRNTHVVKGPKVESSSLWYCPGGCGRKYKQKFDLNRHVNSQCGKVKLFTCDYCWNSFTQKSSLKSHIFNRHIIKKHKKLKCTNRCGRTYRYKRSLTYHLKHECGVPKKQISCELCPKVFNRKPSLSRHLRVVHQKIIVSNGSRGKRSISCTTSNKY